MRVCRCAPHRAFPLPLLLRTRGGRDVVVKLALLTGILTALILLIIDRQDTAYRLTLSVTSETSLTSPPLHNVTAGKMAGDIAVPGWVPESKASSLSESIRNLFKLPGRPAVSDAGVKVEDTSATLSLEQLAQRLALRLNASDSLGGEKQDYRVVYDILALAPTQTSQQDEKRDKFDVTIATQCSSNHLHYVVGLSERWRGPISVAVLTYDQDFSLALKSILYYHHCHPLVAKFVSFHVVFPSDRPAKDVRNLLAVATDTLSCSTSSSLEESEGTAYKNYALDGLPYPANLLRNVAIRRVTTSHVLTLDIDIVPSANLRQQFAEFLTRRTASSSSKGGAGGGSENTRGAESAQISDDDAKTAYILPVIEVVNGTTPPSSKVELLGLWDRGLARPFNSAICNLCTAPTNYSRWRNLTARSEGGVDEAFTVTYRPDFEPFYVARVSTLPLYDARFIQYGYNRISQVCELHFADYRFVVMDNGFLVHQGFRDVTDFHATRQSELRDNLKLHEHFERQLHQKYKTSARHCIK